MATEYEFYCPRHDATAYAPPEGGPLNFDRPCDCSHPDNGDIVVTKIDDGLRKDQWTISAIEGRKVGTQWKHWDKA